MSDRGTTVRAQPSDGSTATCTPGRHAIVALVPSATSLRADDQRPGRRSRDPPVATVRPRSPYRFSGPRLRGLREREGMTRRELARLVGRSAGSIQSYEEKHGTPSLKTLCDLAGALDVTPNELFRCFDDDQRERAEGEQTPGRLRIAWRGDPTPP